MHKTLHHCKGWESVQSCFSQLQKWLEFLNDLNQLKIYGHWNWKKVNAENYSPGGKALKFILVIVRQTSNCVRKVPKLKSESKLQLIFANLLPYFVSWSFNLLYFSVKYYSNYKLIFICMVQWTLRCIKRDKICRKSLTVSPTSLTKFVVILKLACDMLAYPSLLTLFAT